MAALTNTELVAALTRRRRPPAPPEEPGLRFAFYGRMSTSGFQDVETSRAWQRAMSEELIDGVGSLVVEFFDVGVSRRWAWQERPEAAALLAAAAAPGRAFDAVVVGEYERAFYGDQFRDVASGLNALGVAVWLPEAGGPVELGSPVHEALMVLLVRRRSARWRGLGSECSRRCGLRRGCRAGFWVVGRRMGIGLLMVGGIRIRCMVDGVGGCRCWRRIR